MLIAKLFNNKKANRRSFNGEKKKNYRKKEKRGRKEKKRGRKRAK